MNKVTLKKLLAALLAGISIIASTAAWSGIAVIVNPNNANALSDSDISRIFLGKKKLSPMVLRQFLSIKPKAQQSVHLLLAKF